MHRQPMNRRPRQLPKLYSCLSKISQEHLHNKLLYDLEILDSAGVRRIHEPIYECLVKELKESGYKLSSSHLQDLIHDSEHIVSEDDLGVVIDLRKRKDYLDHICKKMKQAEKEHNKGNLKKETLYLLELARYFAVREKGILWLADKFYLASIAVASQYLCDGGRQRACCKYHYAKFLLETWPGLDDEEPYNLLTEVRNSAIGKGWMLLENNEPGPPVTVFDETAVLLHIVLLNKARRLRLTDTFKAERIARLAEKRAKDAEDITKVAEAIIEIGVCQSTMNNFHNAQKTFERALQIYQKSNDINGICETKMHLAVVMQRFGAYEIAEKLLIQMGVTAMDHGLRRHLGRALHLLGELHLKMEKPKLGTQHLYEAFECFMGVSSNAMSPDLLIDSEKLKKQKDIIPITPDETDMFSEEAEQSRIMTAISAGQELMASYFDQLREAETCQVARMKCMEWKSNKSGWWVNRPHHDNLPCLCAKHNRTSLDVLRTKLASMNEDSAVGMDAANTVDDDTSQDVKDTTRKRYSTFSNYISTEFES